MKKGSKARKCDKCGKIVAWEVPTGEVIQFCIPVYEDKLLPNCVIIDKGLTRYWRCKNCFQPDAEKMMNNPMYRIHST